MNSTYQKVWKFKETFRHKIQFDYSKILGDMIYFILYQTLFVGIQQKGVDFMGKDLKGKELGVGICQRKDGLYTARFTGKDGKRRQKYFKKLQECRKWIADAQFEDGHGNINASRDMTVDAWFEYWIENIKAGNVKTRTLQNYKDRYYHNIAPFIGKMLLADVKPLHCQNVLNQMAGAGYCSSTIGLARITVATLFGSAVENQLICNNPVSKTVRCAGGTEPKPERVLTHEEQRIFLEAIKGKSNYNQYAFVLQTRLRAGELAGLKWSDIDFGRGMLNVARTVDYRSNGAGWEIRKPKSRAGMREVPLTKEALRILGNQKRKVQSISVLEMEYQEFVFLSKNGNPIKNSTFNKDLARICGKAGLEHFSMHTLRHTFATRCAESGLKPKTLQSILGHSNIGITMDVYVHCTSGQKAQEVRDIEASLQVV